MIQRFADALATSVLIATLVWALGVVIGVWWIVAGVLGLWAIVRGLPVWAPIVRAGAGILWGDRYSDADTIQEVFAMGGQDVSDEVVPLVLEAARRVHNWASRFSTALISVIGLLAMWAARPTWQPLVFLIFASLVCGAAAWPAIKRRWDERNGT